MLNLLLLYIKQISKQGNRRLSPRWILERLSQDSFCDQIHTMSMSAVDKEL
jgi:hypothetical protein